MAVLDAVAAQSVEDADGAAGGDGGDGARARVARYATAGCEGGEDEGDVAVERGGGLEGEGRWWGRGRGGVPERLVGVSRLGLS